jgi:hypothetical protein
VPWYRFIGMLPGVVAIDFPEQTPRAWVEAATSACQAALGDDRCVAGRTTTPHAWRAAVELSDEPEAPVLLIELYDVSNEALESARQLRFQDIDPERQRWASAGVVIAAMVSAGEAGTPVQTEPVDTLPLGPVPRERTWHSEPVRRSRLWVDGAAALERSFAAQLPALGFTLGVGARPLEPPLIVGGGVSVAWASVPLDSTRITGRVGSGWRLVDGPVSWDASAQLRVQYYTVVARRTLGGLAQTDTGSHWRHAPTLETGVAVRALDSLGLTVAGDVGWYSRHWTFWSKISSWAGCRRSVSGLRSVYAGSLPRDFLGSDVEIDAWFRPAGSSPLDVN